MGAGAVGLEFASFFHDVGVKVTLLEYLPRIVPLEDARGQPGRRAEPDEARGHDHDVRPLRHQGRQDDEDRGDDDGRPRGQGGRRSSRRRCSSSPPGAPRTSRTSASRRPGSRRTRASSRSTASLRTKEPHVYAIGDIIGGLWLAHTAAHEGILAAHVIAGDKDVHEMDYVKQPRATYCRPEIASIGLTEQQCKDAGDPDQDRQGAVPGDRQGAHRRRVRGLRQGHRPRRDRRHARDPPGRAARHGPHRGGVAGLRARGDAVGDRGVDPRPPTLSEILGEAAMAVDGRSINF